MLPCGKNYPAIARILSNLSQMRDCILKPQNPIPQNPVPQARDPILRRRDPIPLAPGGAESHFAEVMKLFV